MKKCLYCEREFEAKRDAAKFCSVSHRVMWNRKNKFVVVEHDFSEGRTVLDAMSELMQEIRLTQKKIDNIINDRSNPFTNAARGRDESGINENELVPKKPISSTLATYLSLVEVAENTLQLQNILLSAKSKLSFFDNKELERVAGIKSLELGY